MKALIKDLTPPALWRALVAVKNAIKPPPPAEPLYGYFGDFPTWGEAVAQCAGYESPEIISTTLVRTRALAINPPVPLDSTHMRLLAALRACAFEGCRVLDFGGAMGGQYFMLRRLLPRLSWTVVDLPATTAAATRGLACDDRLRFTTTAEPADIIVASGVLQCCEDPYATLEMLAALKPKHLIVARLPLIDRDRLTAHRVDPRLFNASHPAWFMAQETYEAATRGLGLKPVIAWDYPEYRVQLDDAVVPYYGWLYAVSAAGSTVLSASGV